jgi:hypothetical protein
MKSKLLLYLLIAVAIVAIAAFVIYQLVYRGNSNAPEVTGQTGSLPSAANQQFPSATQTSTVVSTLNTSSAIASSSRFGIISNDPAVDYFVSPTNIVSIIKPDGTIELIANNVTSIFSTSTISNIVTAAFSYDGKKALITYRVGTTTQSSVFDDATRTWTRLPSNMQSPAWSPIDYRVAYLSPSNTGSETLMTIDAGTANAKPAVISTLTMEDMLLQWPNKNTMIVSDRPSAYIAGSIWLFNVSSKTLSPMVYENRGAESLWNTFGSALIFSAGSGNAGGQLTFQSATGTQKTLSFGTLPSKCTFGSSVIIYCAVPHNQNMFSLARLPDEYDQDIYFTNDDFYRVDASIGSLSEIFSSSAVPQNLDATRVKIFNNILFFINRYDQKIYALAL